MWRISKVQDWIYHQLLGNGKKSEAVGVKVNFKENLKQLLFRHLKKNKFKVKIAGRVKPAKLTQHFNATSCNIVKSSWEMLCGSWPNARNTLQNTKFWLFSNLIQHVATGWPNLCNTLRATMLQDIAFDQGFMHLSVSKQSGQVQSGQVHLLPATGTL